MSVQDLASILVLLIFIGIPLGLLAGLHISSTLKQRTKTARCYICSVKIKKPNNFLLFAVGTEPIEKHPICNYHFVQYITKELY